MSEIGYIDTKLPNGLPVQCKYEYIKSVKGSAFAKPGAIMGPDVAILEMRVESLGKKYDILDAIDEKYEMAICKEIVEWEKS